MNGGMIPNAIHMFIVEHFKVITSNGIQCYSDSLPPLTGPLGVARIWSCKHCLNN